MACGPVDIWYKPDGTSTKAKTDLTNCEVQAVQQVPPNVVTRTTPTLASPALNSCYRVGGTLQCRGFPHVYAPPTITQVDLNADLRGRVVEQCMTQKGYAPVSLPKCSDADLANAGSPLRSAAPGTPSACVVRTNEDTWAVVAPGAPT